MKLPPSLTTVTLFSKLLAVILFFTFIISGFYAGMKYQAMIDLIKYQQTNPVTSKPSLTPIPKISPTGVDRKTCGGIAGIPCPTGYTCTFEENFPDAPGVCLKQDRVACTMEAKLCPDGKTYVSRTGPNCDFSPCP